MMMMTTTNPLHHAGWHVYETFDPTGEQDAVDSSFSGLDDNGLDIEFLFDNSQYTVDSPMSLSIVQI